MQQDAAHEDEERHRDEREARRVRPRDRADDAEPDREALEVEEADDADDAERDGDLDAEREEHEQKPDENGAEQGLAHSSPSGPTSSRRAAGPSVRRTWRTSVMAI